MTPRRAIYDAINRECGGYQGALYGTHHDVPAWLLIAEAELIEAKLAWVNGESKHGALRKMLQVVATLVACLESHGVVERERDMAS